MTLKDTIERFAHLDIVLGDPAWCADSLPWTTAHELWEAVKAGRAEIEAKSAQLAEARAKINMLSAQLAEVEAEDNDILTGAMGKEYDND